ncbi:hypothetical protein [Marinobacter zhejiangensis]|uniref:Tetratricopeptide repeat-containing protein n=1 Tax=Marinobacter zhejiangensis TaxID=488535 RepID=A0A1I4SZW5_9GAMM|nr:hypothetical protein [Marinobacter zhejiangensis]SFM69870.1 hypothetical protein SAMN04487963_3406 [Marinobacter zhejiangensis]
MKSVLVVLLAVMLVGCASMVRDGAIIRVQDNLADGDYADAIAIADRALNAYDYSDDQRAQLLFMKAVSYQNLEDYQTALALYGYLAYKYPDTEYGFRAATILESVEQSRGKQGARPL